jgi:hypothetical protein
MFTTGSDFSSNDKSRLKTVVELAAAKMKVRDLWCPDLSACRLIISWAHKPPCSFAADVMNSNFVVAREIQLESPFGLHRLQGWILTQGHDVKLAFEGEESPAGRLSQAGHLPSGENSESELDSLEAPAIVSEAAATDSLTSLSKSLSNWVSASSSSDD